MKSFLTVIFALLFSSIFCQTISIQPNWKVGETKTIKTYSENTEFSGEDEPYTRMDTTEGPSILVVEEDADNYYVQVEVEDQNLMMLNSLIQTYEVDIDTEEKVKVKISVSKSGMGWTIANFEEVKSILEGKLDKVNAAMGEKNPQMKELMVSYLEPVSSGVKSQDAMKFTFLREIDYLFLPFQRSWEQGKMYTDSATGPNPMNPAITTTFTYKNVLSSVNKKENIAILEQETLVDMDGFIKLIKEKLQQMAELMDKPEKGEAFDNVVMNMSNQLKLEVNMKTGWVETAIGEITIEGSFPGESKKTVSKVRKVLE
jgi:hypothetical protein